MDDALVAYDTGHADGGAGRDDAERATDPATGPDYRVGVLDGQVAAFEHALITAVRQALGEPGQGSGPGRGSEPGQAPGGTA